MDESSGSQFFVNITGLQSGPDILIWINAHSYFKGYVQHIVCYFVFNV